MIQGGVCVKVLPCILFTDIFDSIGSTSCEGQKVLLFFSFLSKCCLYFEWKVQS